MWVPIFSIDSYLLEFGFYSPYSNGKIKEWTHPDTLSFLNCSENLYSRRNLTGGIVGINPKSEFGINLISKWHKLCLIPDCISPIGSSRENHRQDQSILSVIFHQERKNFYFKTKKISNILSYMDTNYINYQVFNIESVNLLELRSSRASLYE